MNKLSQVRETLREFNVDPDEVLCHVVPDDPDSIVLFSGSLNEGLGNSRSDIDILIVYPSGRHIEGLPTSKMNSSTIITPASARGAITTWQRDILVVFHKLKTEHRLNIFITNADIISFLQDQAASWLNFVQQCVAGNPPSARGLALFFAEHRLLHRFYTGAVLHNDEKANKLRSRFPFEDFVQYTVFKKTRELNSVIEDLFGVLDKYPDSEEETKLLILQQAFMKLASVLLAAVGEANPGEKFLFRLVKRNRDKIGSGLVDRFLQVFRYLHPESTTNPQIALKLIDDVFSFVASLNPLFAADLKASGHKPFSDISSWKIPGIFLAAPQEKTV